MNASTRRYVYGPVPSRRLGRSLGVDLVPFKTCTYDCVYCQLGRTTSRTLERREYAPVGDVLDEVRIKMGEGAEPDYITLAGSGEPTLHGRIGELIAGIKGMTGIPLAVITNGSLLWDREVAESLMPADLVIPSLDAGDAAMFGRTNRPHPGIEFDRMVGGLAGFRQRYRGLVWLEVMLVDGLNDSKPEAGRIAELAGRIRPDRVDLNTAVRPPAEDWVRAVAPDRMKELSRLFPAPVDIIAPCERPNPEALGPPGMQEEIVSMLARRPCTAEDVAAGLGVHRLSALKYLEALVENGGARKVEAGDRWFYVTKNG